MAFDGQWHFIAFSWGNGVLRLFIDGVEDTNVVKSTDDAITTLHNSTAKVSVGCEFNSGAAFRFLDGTVDEVALFATTLSPEQIYDLYRIGVAPYQRVNPGGNGNLTDDGVRLYL